MDLFCLPGCSWLNGSLGPGSVVLLMFYRVHEPLLMDLFAFGVSGYRLFDGLNEWIGSG